LASLATRVLDGGGVTAARGLAAASPAPLERQIVA
jgi:hypothetical protein